MNILGNNIDFVALFALLISIITFGYTAWRDRKMDARVKQVEVEQQREKEEASLIHSKAFSPYFSPANVLVNHVYDFGENGHLICWNGMGKNVLSTQNREIPKDAPEDTSIILVLDNNGKGARKVILSGDIPKAEIRQEPDVDSARGLIFLRYPYSPSHHGKKQRINVSFESEDGHELTHVYETRHGFFEFQRVEPK